MICHPIGRRDQGKDALDTEVLCLYSNNKWYERVGSNVMCNDEVLECVHVAVGGRMPHG